MDSRCRRAPHSGCARLDIDVVYVGGYSTEAGLILRQGRHQGFEAQLVSGDALTNDEFWMITGPAGEGTLVTFGPDPRANAAAAPVVRRFRGQGFDPLGYTLHTYAAGKGMGAGGPEGRVRVLADRGMISAAALEERGLEYILGVRERSTKEVREVVLADEVPLVTITVPRQKRPDTELQAKQARLGKVRYIVCRNPAEAERDAAGRGLHPSSKPNGEWARNLSRRSFGEPYNAAQNALASSMVGSGQLEPARSSVIR